MVVEDDDLERARRGLPKSFLGADELRPADAAGLVAPRPDGVEADDVERRRRVRRLRRLPVALELAERPHEPCREGVRDVVVARDGQHRRPEAAQETRCMRELVLAPAVAEIAACDQELRLEALDERRGPALDCLVVSRAVVQVRQVKHARRHRRGRL